MPGTLGGHERERTVAGLLARDTFDLVSPPVPVGKRSAQRPQGAEATGIVTRRAKTAQRASWSRAGRSPARRNRARRPAAGRAVAHTPKNQPPPRHGANPQNPNPHVNMPGPERRRRDSGEESPQAGPPGKRAPASAGGPGRRERSERGFCFCRCGGTKGAAGREATSGSLRAREEGRRAGGQASGTLL